MNKLKVLNANNGTIIMLLYFKQSLSNFRINLLNKHVFLSFINVELLHENYLKTSNIAVKYLLMAVKMNQLSLYLG